MKYMYQYFHDKHIEDMPNSSQSFLNISNVTTTLTTLQNTYTDDSTYVRIVNGTVIILLLMSGLFVNGSLVALFTTKSQLRTASNLLLTSLAVSNCVLCFLVLPANIVNIFHTEIKYEGTLCYIVGLFSQLWWVSNIYTLTFLSVDRYLLISNPLCYKQVMTPTRAKIYIATSWTLAIIIAVIPTIGWTHYSYSSLENTCTVDWKISVSFNITFTIVSFWIPCVVIIYCYISIVWNARGNVRRIDVMMSTRMFNRRNSIYKTVKTSFIIVSTFLLAWVPYFVLIYIYSFNQQLFISHHWKMLQTSKYFPVFIYPYVFAFRNSSLKIQLKMFYDQLKIRRDIRKIEPSRTIDETDFPDNVSRRNSRTESQQSMQQLTFNIEDLEQGLKKSSRQNSLNSAIIERGVHSRQKSLLFIARQTPQPSLPAVDI